MEAHSAGLEVEIRRFLGLATSLPFLFVLLSSVMMIAPLVVPSARIEYRQEIKGRQKRRLVASPTFP